MLSYTQAPSEQEEQILEAYRFRKEYTDKMRSFARMEEYTAPDLILAWREKTNKKLARLRKLFRDNVEALDILSDLEG